METKEKCWTITENRPIKIQVQKSWTGTYYTLKAEPMTMLYETALRLGDNLTQKAIEYGNKQGIVYKENVAKFPNDVSMSSYNYENGSVQFSASTMQDVKNWFELYKSIVTEN